MNATARRGSAPDTGDWVFFAHDMFLDQVEALVTQVQALRAREPHAWRQKNAAKRLAAIVHLAFDDIPQDPTRPEFRLGGALGNEHIHWFRAKFFQQYRLFFRYHAAARVIVLAWVNDEQSLRAYDKNSDAYAVFRKMLHKGRPPDDWSLLLRQAQCESKRLARVQGQLRLD